MSYEVVQRNDDPLSILWYQELPRDGDQKYSEMCEAADEGNIDLTEARIVLCRNCKYSQEYRYFYIKGELYRVFYHRVCVDTMYQNATSVKAMMWKLLEIFPECDFVHESYAKFPDNLVKDSWGIHRIAQFEFPHVFDNPYTTYFDQNVLNEYMTVCRVCGNTVPNINTPHRSGWRSILDVLHDEGHENCHALWMKHLEQIQEDEKCLKNSKQLLQQVQKALHQDNPREALKSLRSELTQDGTLPT